MSLIFMEGFDHFNTRSQLYTKPGWTGSAASAVNIISGRFSGNTLRIEQSLTYVLKALPSTYSTLYFGTAFQLQAVGTPILSTTYPTFKFSDEAGTAQVKVTVNASKGLNIYKGDNTLIGSTADNIITSTVWGYLEIKIIIHATAGEVTIKYNGTQVFSDTAADTKNGTDYINNITFRAVYNNLDTYFDDMWADDAQYHGNCQIKAFVPDTDSATHTAFARSTGSNDYECVDDNPPNDDTDYIYSATLADKSTFLITTGALETVKGVQVNNRAKVTAAGTRKIKTLVRSNGADYQGAEEDVTATYKFNSDIWETDPDDSNPWTQTKLEAAEYGLEITD